VSALERPVVVGVELKHGYFEWRKATGRAVSAPDRHAARRFFERWPQPAAWAAEPMSVRLSACAQTRPLLTFLMLHGHLRPGYDYLLERKLPALLRETPASPLGEELKRFEAAAVELDYKPAVAARHMGSQVLLRVLIQTGKRTSELREADLLEFDRAIREREHRRGGRLPHYRNALIGARGVIYHLGAAVEPPTLRRGQDARWSWERRLAGVPEALVPTFVAYLECCLGTRRRSTVSGIQRGLS